MRICTWPVSMKWYLYCNRWVLALFSHGSRVTTVNMGPLTVVGGRAIWAFIMLGFGKTNNEEIRGILGYKTLLQESKWINWLIHFDSPSRRLAREIFNNQTSGSLSMGKDTEKGSVRWQYHFSKCRSRSNVQLKL